MDDDTLKTKLAEGIALNLGFAPDKIPLIRDAIQIVVEPDDNRYIGWSFSGRLWTLDDEIDHHGIASLVDDLAENYREERVEIPSFTGFDPEKTWMQYADEAREGFHNS